MARITSNVAPSPLGFQAVGSNSLVVLLASQANGRTLVRGPAGQPGDLSTHRSQPPRLFSWVRGWLMSTNAKPRIPAATWESRASAQDWFATHHHVVFASDGSVPGPLDLRLLAPALDQVGTEDRELSDEVAALLARIDGATKTLGRKLEARFEQGTWLGDLAQIQTLIRGMTNEFGRDGRAYVRTPKVGAGQTVKARLRNARDLHVIWWCVNVAHAQLDPTLAALAAVAMGVDGPCNDAEGDDSPTARVDRWRKRLAGVRKQLR